MLVVTANTTSWSSMKIVQKTSPASLTARSTTSSRASCYSPEQLVPGAEILFRAFFWALGCKDVWTQMAAHRLQYTQDDDWISIRIRPRLSALMLTTKIRSTNLLRQPAYQAESRFSGLYSHDQHATVFPFSWLQSLRANRQK